MKVTYYGQSGFGIETAGKTLVFDPFISPNELAKDIDVNNIKADYVLLSHGHGDHVADAEPIAKNNNATIISNYEIVTYFGEKGITGHPLNHGGKSSFDFGTVKYVNAVHSSVLPDGTYGGNPGGFVIWNDEKCFYFAGDTALTMDMKLIPMTCPKLDFRHSYQLGTILLWDMKKPPFASEFIECDQVIGCHYDTFGYIKIDHEAAKKAFADRGKELILLSVGSSIEI